MDPISTVLREIRRRVLVAEQILESNDGIDGDAALQLTDSLESAARNLIRFEGLVPTPLFENYLETLQGLLRFLASAVSGNRPRSFRVGSRGQGTIDTIIIYTNGVSVFDYTAQVTCVKF